VPRNPKPPSAAPSSEVTPSKFTEAEAPAVRDPRLEPLYRQISALENRVASQQAQWVMQAERMQLLIAENQALRDEIARLKGLNQRPKILPSRLEPKKKTKKKRKGKRPGSKKRSKTRNLAIDEEVVVAPEEPIPDGSRFKGYEDYTVQDLLIRAHTTRYRRERWVTPEGKTLWGKLPEGVIRHFGPALDSFVLYQYYHAHVTQPLILEQLRERGVDISAGEVNRIITEGHGRFHAEKDEILAVGLQVSGHVHVDDTGARHNGRNGVCTHIGNALFAWFASTQSKSRVNFLELLGAGRSEYLIDETAFNYMKSHKLPNYIREQLSVCTGQSFATRGQWHAMLSVFDICAEHHVRTATEGALFAALLDNGLRPDLAIISDDAGQFKVLLHGLCWVHAERTLAKLIGVTDEQRAALESSRGEVWDLYRDIKAYCEEPTELTKAELSHRFDLVFTRKTGYTSLDLALKRLHKNKAELLLVLDRPDIPLHNNPSENDIREYVKRRKVSGSTRSEDGRRCRDTFTSLKKTCRKLGVSFWSYLHSRTTDSGDVAYLPDLMHQAAGELPRPAT